MKSSDEKKIIFFVNKCSFFVSHRLELGLSLVSAGFDVTVVAANDKGSDILIKNGISFIPLSWTRSKVLHFFDLYALLSIFVIIRKLRPSIVHVVGLKPICFVGSISFLFDRIFFVYAISGLGSIFISNSFVSKLKKVISIFVMRCIFSKKRCTCIVQNQDDLAYLLRKKVIEERKVKLINGSGVNLSLFQYHPEPEGVKKVIMPSRLTHHKGVWDFFSAAKILHKNKVNVKMCIVGEYDDDNPSAILFHERQELERSECIEILGFQSDMPTVYRDCHIVCLPSYREGLPLCLIEAAACGRAVITTDVPGCRDVIVPHETGLLVPVNNASCLATAITKLVQEDEVRIAYGANGRKLAENRFSSDIIIREHISIYNNFFTGSGKKFL